VPYRDDREFLLGQVELLQGEADLGRSAREQVKVLEGELAEARQTIDHLELERVQAVVAAKSAGVRERVAQVLVVCSVVLGVVIARSLFLHNAAKPVEKEDLAGYDPGCGPASTVWPSSGEEGCHRLKCSMESLMAKHPGITCQECPLELVPQRIEPGKPPRFACQQHFRWGGRTAAITRDTARLRTRSGARRSSEARHVPGTCPARATSGRRP
jgi:hypothetical protein